MLVTSFLGSSHCVAMCGGLVLSLGNSKGSRLLGYHLGRLTGYSLLGALAGLMGKKVFDSELFSALPWFAATLMGFSFIILGVQVLRGQSPALFKIPSTYLIKLHQLTGNAAFTIGLFSALLPCGWLHTFVLGAVATRNPIQGALYLNLFWLGTIPALSLTQVISDSLLKPLKRIAPRSAGFALIVIGIFSLSYKMYPLIHSSLQNEPEQVHYCH